VTYLLFASNTLILHMILVCAGTVNTTESVMQTFLPYPDFHDSALCLDNKRLGKQRVEALTLLRGKWPNHPASIMWQGYDRCLALYGIVICREWRRRGFKDSCLPEFLERWKSSLEATESLQTPPWLGDAAFHASHRSNLLRKDPEWYGQFGWEEPDDLR